MRERIRIGVALLGISLLPGCVVTKQTYGPDGRTAVSMNCSGIAMSWASCYEKAGAICGARGYDVLAVNGETGAVIVANPQGAFGSTVLNRTMMVACKERQNPAPAAAPAAASQSQSQPQVAAKCATRVISAGGKPVPEEEQC